MLLLPELMLLLPALLLMLVRVQLSLGMNALVGANASMITRTALRRAAVEVLLEGVRAAVEGLLEGVRAAVEVLLEGVALKGTVMGESRLYTSGALPSLCFSGSAS
jgi:hypothetical protein